MLRPKWVIWTLEPQLDDPRVLYIGGELLHLFLVKYWRDCGSFWNGVRTSRQSDLEVVRLQFFSLAFVLGVSDP